MIHGGPFKRPLVRPITRSKAKRMEEEEGILKSLLLWRVDY